MKKIITLLILLIFQFNTTQATVAPDPAFSGDGIKLTKINASRDDISQSVAIAPDGKIVVAGNSINSTGYTNTGLVRFTSNGNNDATFNLTGKLVINNAFCSNVAVQPDAKILVLGTVRVNNKSVFKLWRFNADGTPDNTFGTSGKKTVAFTNDVISFALTLQSDGKILIGGYEEADGGSVFHSMALARLTPSGALDNTFNSDGKFKLSQGRWTLDCHEILVQPDGKIVTAGKADTTTLSAIIYSHFFATRLNSNGTLDGAFGNNGVVKQRNSYNDYCYSAGLLPGGNIILGGFSIISSANFASALCLTAAGNVNTSFGTNGWKYVSFAGSSMCREVLIESNGKIILAGSANLNAVGLARLNSNGTTDATFGNNGTDTLAFDSMIGCNAAALQPDGKIICTGYKNQSMDYFLTVRFTNTVLRIPANSMSGEMVQPVVYPNPVAGHLMKLTLAAEKGKAEIRFYDMSGREVLPVMNATVADGILEKEITLPSNIKDGIYFCTVIMNADKKTTRFIVEH